VARCDDIIQMVDSEVGEFAGKSGAKSIGWYAKVGLCEQLRVGLGLREAQAKKGRRDRRYAKKETRERERLTLADIRATEARNVANQAQPEMIVEEAEASPDNGLGIDGPRKANAWRKISFLVECRVVVPAQPRIDRQIVPDIPVILNQKPS
jgi:hypothetical protein